MISKAKRDGSPGGYGANMFIMDPTDLQEAQVTYKDESKEEISVYQKCGRWLFNDMKYCYDVQCLARKWASADDFKSTIEDIFGAYPPAEDVKNFIVELAEIAGSKFLSPSYFSSTIVNQLLQCIYAITSKSSKYRPVSYTIVSGVALEGSVDEYFSNKGHDALVEKIRKKEENNEGGR